MREEPHDMALQLVNRHTRSGALSSLMQTGALSGRRDGRRIGPRTSRFYLFHLTKTNRWCRTMPLVSSRRKYTPEPSSAP